MELQKLRLENNALAIQNISFQIDNLKTIGQKLVDAQPALLAEFEAAKKVEEAAANQAALETVIPGAKIVGSIQE
jgi:hypothetical protein